MTYKDKEKAKEYHKKWAEENREHLNKYHSEWCKNHREKRNATQRKYKEKKKNATKKFI